MNDVAVIEKGVITTQEQSDLLKRTICKGATEDEFKLFIGVCHRTQLDPFARQIYAVKRYDGKTGKEIMSIQVSIDGFRLVAQRSGEYAGQTPVQWCGPDGVWTDVWLKKEPPAAAKVGVYRKGFSEALYAVAKWDSYKQTFKREGKEHLTPMWEKMPELMLGKVAEALALRRAFPQELSGLYTTDEMAQAGGEDTTRELEPSDPIQPVKQIETPKPHGHLDRAIPAIRLAKTANDIASIKRKIALSAWTEEESLKLDDEIKNVEQAIKEGVSA